MRANDAYPEARCGVGKSPKSVPGLIAEDGGAWAEWRALQDRRGWRRPGSGLPLAPRMIASGSGWCRTNARLPRAGYDYALIPASRRGRATYWALVCRRRDA